MKTSDLDPELYVRWFRNSAPYINAHRGRTFVVAFSGAALALDVGDKAPNFALPSTTAKEIKLADFAGKRNVVLFFYIGAFTDT